MGCGHIFRYFIWSMRTILRYKGGGGQESWKMRVHYLWKPTKCERKYWNKFKLQCPTISCKNSIKIELSKLKFPNCHKYRFKFLLKTSKENDNSTILLSSKNNKSNKLRIQRSLFGNLCHSRIWISEIAIGTFQMFQFSIRNWFFYPKSYIVLLI